MAIRVSCPSCKADVHVDDTLAGKDIICPSCRERMTVPSLASGSPDAKAGAAGDDYDDDEHIRERDSGVGGLPRWDDRADYDVPRRHDAARWNATLTGLGLIFWTTIIAVVISAVIVGLSLMMGSNPQFMFGAPGAQPRPEMMALALVVSGLGCVLLILAIIAFVGMCMCCTVPSESGAKGRAITAVILVCVSVVMFIAIMVVMWVVAINQFQRMGGPPAPGQLPFSPAMIAVVAVVAVLDVILLVTLWLMFHKAIANYFQNARLSRQCVWYVIAIIVYEVGSVLMQFIGNPVMQGNLMAAPGVTPWMIIIQIWGLAWMLGLSTWYLLIIRETRRTILEDQVATADNPLDDDRG